MLAVALSLACALAYGSADFLGGLASRRAGMFAVVLISQAAGLAALLAVLPFLSGHATTSDLVAGAIAGIFGAGGIALLYRALAIGRMGIVSPITAVLAAATPVIASFARGERASLAADIGMLVALASVVLISSAPDVPAAPNAPATLAPAARAQRRALRLGSGVLTAIASGVILGGFFVALSTIGKSAGLIPLVPARIASMATIVVVALLLRSTLIAPRATLTMIVVSGVLDMAANVLFVLATRTGLLSIVAVLSSLYPAATVALASIALRERMSRRQWVGLTGALIGVALLAKT